jgi:hypothetical protein
LSQDSLAGVTKVSIDQLVNLFPALFQKTRT